MSPSAATHARAGILILLFAVASTNANAQVIFSSSFDSDDTGFFTYSGPPSGQLSFDATLGFPSPGSMRLTRNEATNSAFARTSCLPFDPARRHVIRADSLQDTAGGQCQLSYELFTTSDCSGDVFLDFSAGNTQTGAWERLETFAGTADLGHEEFASIRFRMTLSGVVPAACNFDNVYIASEQVESIPLLSPAGKLSLLVILPLLGLYLLRSTD